jgi:hypothetical protein
LSRGLFAGRLVRVGLPLLALAALPACEKEEDPKPLTSGDTTALPTGPIVNPEIAEAVAQAGKAPENKANAENAPPENGILAPARADADAPAGAPAKVVLGSAGSDPKIVLGGPDVTDKRIGQMTVSVRTGPNTGMPGVAFRFEASGKAQEAGAPHEVALEVMEAKLSDQQMGQVPEDVAKAIATMRGGALRYKTVAGTLLGIDFALGKKSDPRMDVLLSSAADALTTALISYPKEPVGQGGFWMVTARERLGLGEVVGYHLVKVESIEGPRVTLSVNTKRYLASTEFQGLPAVQFLGAATTDLVVVPGQRLPLEGRTQQTLQAMVQSQDGSPRPLQYELRALFAFPTPEDAAAATSTTAPRRTVPASSAGGQ